MAGRQCPAGQNASMQRRLLLPAEDRWVISLSQISWSELSGGQPRKHPVSEQCTAHRPRHTVTPWLTDP